MPYKICAIIWVKKEIIFAILAIIWAHRNQGNHLKRYCRVVEPISYKTTNSQLKNWFPRWREKKKIFSVLFWDWNWHQFKTIDLVNRSNANVPIDFFHKQIFNKIFIINLIWKMEYMEFTVDNIYSSLWIFWLTVKIPRKNMIIFARHWLFFSKIVIEYFRHFSRSKSLFDNY